MSNHTESHRKLCMLLLAMALSQMISVSKTGIRFLKWSHIFHTD